jgi:hypothetical protein
MWRLELRSLGRGSSLRDVCVGVGGGGVTSPPLTVVALRLIPPKVAVVDLDVGITRRSRIILRNMCIRQNLFDRSRIRLNEIEIDLHSNIVRCCNLLLSSLIDTAFYL